MIIMYKYIDLYPNAQIVISKCTKKLYKKLYIFKKINKFFMLNIKIKNKIFSNIGIVFNTFLTTIAVVLSNEKIILIRQYQLFFVSSCILYLKVQI